MWWTPPTQFYTLARCLFLQLHCGTPLPSCSCSQLSNKIIGVAPFSPQHRRLLRDEAPPPPPLQALLVTHKRNSHLQRNTHACVLSQRRFWTKFLANWTAEMETCSHNKWKSFKTKDPLFWVQTHPRKTVSFLQWTKQRLFKNCSLWFWVAQRNWIGVQSHFTEGHPSTTKTMELEKRHLAWDKKT